MENRVQRKLQPNNGENNIRDFEDEESYLTKRENKNNKENREHQWSKVCDSSAYILEKPSWTDHVLYTKYNSKAKIQEAYPNAMHQIKAQVLHIIANLKP